MSFLDRLAKNSYLNIAPLGGQVKCGATRFLWHTHIALPFTLPSRSCLHQEVDIAGKKYKYSIHNYFDRLTVFPASQPTWPSVSLIPRSKPSPQPATGCRQAREVLQSVAHFIDVAESDTPDSAFANADKKITECIRFLSDRLVAMQSSMPYLAA
jgi:hypothetical protein